MPQLPVHTVDTAPPPAFQPAFEACGCFLELACCCFPPPFGPPPSCSGGAVGLGSEDQAGHLKILLLLRQPHKSEPNVWGVPGGKLHLDVVWCSPPPSLLRFNLSLLSPPLVC